MFFFHIIFILYTIFFNKLINQVMNSSSKKIEKFRENCILIEFKFIKMKIDYFTH